MSTYPQGVQTFIPDYQPYEPDFNFALNALQLKQTQYDQNWSKLNNIYGQIVNAPLSHSESASKRANTLNAINFDLQRVTGLDLSLDQNVQQATQVFRPFYEDRNLMKDIAFTRNAMNEKSIAESKRNTDEYWGNGVRFIDERIKDFQALNYNELTSFGDVKYVPYANVEKEALKLAKEMDYTIDITQPSKDGKWMIREKNGKQVLPRLQSIFYATLGKDPRIQAVYGVEAYLKRKDHINNNINDPRFNGDAAAVERDYLENAVSILQKQTQVLVKESKNEVQTNDNRIKRLEAQVRAGDNSARTLDELDRLKKANNINNETLNHFQENYDNVHSSTNGTVTTKGGAELSFDDLELMRAKTDNTIANMLMQVDLNRAAQDVAFKDAVYDMDVNPYGMEYQKYLYSSALIDKREAAQKRVNTAKADNEKQKIIDEARLKSGLYYRDLNTGDVKIKPEFKGVHKLGVLSDTGSTDPIEIMKTLDSGYTKDADKAKSNVQTVLQEMLKNGVLSASDIRYILGADEEQIGFDMRPMLEYLRMNIGNDVAIPTEERDRLLRMGQYTTSLEKEMEGEDAGSYEATSKLVGMGLGSVKDVSPSYIAAVTNRLGNVISKMSADDKIAYNPYIATLNEQSNKLNQYVDYENGVTETRKKLKEEVINKLASEGFAYGEAFFNPYDNSPVQSEEEFIKNALLMFPDDIQLDNGFSWAAYLNTIGTSATGGGLVGTAFGGIGAIPGFIGGAAAGTIAYPLTKLFNYGYNAMFGDKETGDSHSFKDGALSFFGNPLTIRETFGAMQDAYDELVKNSEIKTVPLGVSEKTLLGGGTGYTSEASGVYILPGARGEEYHQWLELQKIIDNNLDAFIQPGPDNFISFKGPEAEYDTDYEANSKTFKAIYEDLKVAMATAPPGDKEAQRFEVGIAPFASGKTGLASIVIKPSKDFLDQYYDSKSGSGFLTADQYNDILANGFNVITDAEKVNQTALYQNAFVTTEEMAIKRAGINGKTYTSWTYPGFSVNYKYNEADPTNQSFAVTKTVKLYNGPDQPYVDQTSYDLVRLGSNIAYDREKFFNETALKIDIQNKQLEKEYGTSAKSE